MSTSLPYAIVWLRHSLRLHDNPMIERCIHEGYRPVVVYITPTRELESDRWGFTPLGSHRKRFLTESLIDLRSQLNNHGVNLLYLEGDVIEELSRVCNALGVPDSVKLYADREYAYLDQKIEAEVEVTFDVTWFHAQLLTNPDDLPFSVTATPQIFTKFRGKIEKYVTIDELAEEAQWSRLPYDDAGIPTTLNEFTTALPFRADDPFPKDDRQAFDFNGGETAALDRLKDYLWTTEHVTSYKETRNGLIGPDYSTKFSAYLSLGCLSPKKVYHEIRRFEEDVVANQSTYWVIFEVLWREFFRYVGWQHGRHLFCPGGIQHKPVKLRRNHQFDAWCKGETGQPFVDANMRELNATGFMSNRGRQNVASYLVHDLGQDWRAGAAYFEHQLLDYDPCSNYGNWNYVAGVGNDPRAGRKFNVAGQAERYDAQGAYTQLWEK
ncbi:MAG: DASH family cryptochrome [Chitinophagales bacterium]